MASQLQLRRGTTAEHATFVGAQAEITVDTDQNIPRIHDGATPGGHPVDFTAVTAVSAALDDVQAVASVSGDVSAVAAIAPDVTAVSDAAASVQAVATNISAVNTAATNIVAIQAAPTKASEAATSASNAAASAASASDSASAAATARADAEQAGNAAWQWAQDAGSAQGAAVSAKENAETAATAATTKASEAAASAQTASDAAATATDKAAIATTKATEAAASAAAAATSETNAAFSATQATAGAASVVSASTTSLTVGTGAQSLTVATGKAYAPGMSVKIARTSDAANTWMVGTVASHDSGTGALIVAVSNVSGAGTFADWTVLLVGPPGADGNEGPPGGTSLTVISADHSAVNGDRLWVNTSGGEVAVTLPSPILNHRVEFANYGRSWETHALLVSGNIYGVSGDIMTVDTNITGFAMQGTGATWEIV